MPGVRHAPRGRGRRRRAISGAARVIHKADGSGTTGAKDDVSDRA